MIYTQKDLSKILPERIKPDDIVPVLIIDENGKDIETQMTYKEYEKINAKSPYTVFLHAVV